jgi:hypothetical protein
MKRGAILLEGLSLLGQAKDRNILGAQKMVGTTGFEPATPASRTRCSTRLSHVPTPCEYILLKIDRQAQTSPPKSAFGRFHMTLLGGFNLKKKEGCPLDSA